MCEIWICGHECVGVRESVCFVCTGLFSKETYTYV